MDPLQKVKIVATLGPASDDEDRLVELFEAGVDVVRLNFSHGSHEEHRARYERVRKAAARIRRPIATLGDLSGPKIRVGRFPGGQIALPAGGRFRLFVGKETDDPSRIPHTYEPLSRDVRPGQRIFLDDGRLHLEVKEIVGDEVETEVLVGGTLKDKKGMNLPESTLSTPALTEKDEADLAFACGLGIDYLALSFVRGPEDMQRAKRLAGDVPVIAKIERPEAVAHLEAILDASDGAMVARGDLGVEIGHEKVPAVQKRIIRECVRRSIPVITATQMLESMIESPQPTRAEVSDVANAALDGTDAVMLSGETAVGKYPLETVRVMSAIIRETEHSSDLPLAVAALPDARSRTFSSAVATAAAAAADRLRLSALAVYTESGSSATDTASLRPSVPIVAFSRHDKVLRRLALVWGVFPVFGAWVQGVAGVSRQAEDVLLERGLVKPGDSIAVTFAMVLAEGEVFQTNMLRLHKVREG